MPPRDGHYRPLPGQFAPVATAARMPLVVIGINHRTAPVEIREKVVFAGEERLFVSRDGGRFWSALSVELPGIAAVELVS